MNRIRNLRLPKGPASTIIKCAAFLLILALVYKLWIGGGGLSAEKKLARLGEADAAMPDWISVQLIDVDGASRRGSALTDMQDIVVHYVANPGSTAQNNHDFFNSAASSVSAHFVIGLDGEIIQCIPLTEKSSASNWRNDDTISIEVCHPDETGQFNDATYVSLLKLCSWLCDLTKIDPQEHIIRHYDITGKLCPLYYVEHEDAWVQFKADVKRYR